MKEIGDRENETIADDEFKPALGTKGASESALSDDELDALCDDVLSTMGAPAADRRPLGN